jgi:DNA modification methylase
VLKLEHWPIDRLIPYARNPRKNDAAVDRMAGAIQEFGFRIPVLAKSDGTVVDGHLRLKAARKLGIESIPVIPSDDLTEPQIKAFRLLANRSVAWAEWDDELLRLELEDLKGLDLDLSLTGFDLQEIDDLLAPIGGIGLTDEDTVPEPPTHPVTQPGDLWVLGRHRLLCGDSTNADDVQRVLNGVVPDLMVIDPPYGVNYRPEWRNEAARAGKIAFAARREGRVANDDRVDWSEAYALFPGAIAYVWHASLFGSQVQDSLERCGFELRSQIIWAKSRFAISRGHYHWQHECCFYAVRKGSNGHWCGGRSQTTLWNVISSSNEEDQNDHGTQKPVELMRRPLLNHTHRGQCVYDPFVGTGTTMIAAETTGRTCFAMDIDARYVDVAIQRWQDFAGQQARLEADGANFETIAERRNSQSD